MIDQRALHATAEGRPGGLDARSLAAEVLRLQQIPPPIMVLRCIRGVPCGRCNGTGVVLYSHTGMWRTEGVHGRAMTPGPCDKCWGSGDSLAPWPSHEEFAALKFRMEGLEK